jgi:hypothetical protein
MPKSTATTARIPSTKPALAPRDMPLLPVDAAAVGLEVEDAVAAAMLPKAVEATAALVPEAGSLAVSNFIVGVADGDDTAVAWPFLSSAESDGLFEFAVGFDSGSSVTEARVWRRGAPSCDLGAFDCVIQTTGPLKVFGIVTTTVSTSSSSSFLRLRCRRTRCDLA